VKEVAKQVRELLSDEDDPQLLSMPKRRRAPLRNFLIPGVLLRVRYQNILKPIHGSSIRKKPIQRKL
jgi:hypothetical protein